MNYLQPTIESLGLQLFQGINVVIDFKKLDLLTLHLLNSEVQKVFVIPDWPCAAWYKSIHRILKSKITSAKLPTKSDLFLDQYGNELGQFSWDHYLCVTSKLQGLGTEI